MSRCDIEFEIVEGEEIYTRVKIGKELKQYTKFLQAFVDKGSEIVKFVRSSRDYDYYMLKGDFLNGNKDKTV